jgi:hypothetical protein
MHGDEELRKECSQKLFGHATASWTDINFRSDDTLRKQCFQEVFGSRNRPLGADSTSRDDLRA